VSVVNDPNAVPIRLTRDTALASGTFVHEEVSAAIFDEVNNVIDANRILAKGQRAFFFGLPVYYRVYAERHHVRQSDEVIDSLLHSGVADFYAPALYWALSLPDKFVVQLLVDLYLHPTNRHAHVLIRTAVLLGLDFAQWLFGKWHAKWNNHPQPPTFYWTFKQMIAKSKETDARLVAARLSPSSRVQVGGDAAVLIKEILDKPERAASLVSEACMRVFEGDDNSRAVARDLDYVAYGPGLQRRAPELAKAIRKAIGERPAGDVVNAAEAE
jgi:hypothetical protein